MYVEDSITINKINTWKPGDVIVIAAPTGSGKTSWVLNNLYQVSKKIVMFTNRDLIKDQTVKQLKQKHVKVVNYQSIEERLLKDYDMDLYNKYDYIVSDECHYFLSDSSFNLKTDLSFDWIINHPDKIVILMSATPEIILDYIEKEKNIKPIKYEMPVDYSFIDKLYFYHDDNAIKKLLLQLPEDEKAIYFTKASKALQTSKELNNATFICSKHNTKYKDAIDIKARQSIIDNFHFDNQILCSTSVLDCGVSIKDKSVKHIIIDEFDLDVIQQCLGRKRILDSTDTITLYIKDHDRGSIKRKIDNLQKSVLYANTLLNDGEIALVKQYKRKNYGNCIYDYVDENEKLHKGLNKLKYQKYLCDISFCQDIIDKKKNSYAVQVCERLKLNIKGSHVLEDEFDSIALQDILQQFIGIIMLEKGEQDRFKDIITLSDSLFSKAKTNHESLGLKTINGYFQDHNLPFILRSKKITSKKSPNYGQYYWMLKLKKCACEPLIQLA